MISLQVKRQKGRDEKIIITGEKRCLEVTALTAQEYRPKNIFSMRRTDPLAQGPARRELHDEVRATERRIGIPVSCIDIHVSDDLRDVLGTTQLVENRYLVRYISVAEIGEGLLDDELPQELRLVVACGRRELVAHCNIIELVKKFPV